MIFRLFFIMLFAFTAPAFAQDDVKPLSEILNPPIDYGNDGKPLTAKIMANYYYKQCAAEETLVFSDDEKELLCACSSANMSEHLSVAEFKALDQDTVKGRNARGNAVAYGYIPCMEYVIETKVMRDCLKSPKLKDIIIGKKRMCGCAVDHMQNFMMRDGTYIIMDTLKHNPMSLNPLEHYFREDSYRSQREHYLHNCRMSIQYELDRR